MCFIGAGDIYLSLVASWCRGTGTGAGSVRRAMRDAGRPGGDGQGGWPRVSRPDGGRGEDGDPRAGASPMCRRARRSGRPLPGRMRQDEEARAGAVHGHAADARGGRARLGRRSPGFVPPRSRRGPRRVPELGDGAGIAMVEFDEGPCREPSPLLAVHVVFLPVPSWSKIPTTVPYG